MLAACSGLRPSLWLQSRCVTVVVQAGYAKNFKKTGKSRRESWQEMGLITEDDPHGFKSVEAAKAIEEWVDLEDKRHVRDLIREEEKRQKLVRFKTIEHKYFKPEQEINLLSWDAKEQMRYLHQEYPEEWTVDRLADSFPVSKKGVFKILRSKFFPKCMDEIVKHDERVKRNWKALTAGDRESDGPIASRYKQLVDEDKIWSLQHAAGIQSLPMPDKSKYLPTVNLNRYNATGAPGLFEKLVKNYCEKKAADETKSPENKELLEQNEAENFKFLQSVTSTKLLKGGEAQRLSIIASPEKQKPVNYEKAFNYADPAMEPEQAEPSAPKQDLHLQSLLDHVEGVATINTEALHRRGRGRGRGRRFASELPADVDPGMYDTQKVGSDKTAIAIATDPEVEEETGPSKQYRITAKQAEVWSQIKYEEERDEGGEDTQAYIYDRTTGYQYPFGRKSEVVDKIDIPKSEDGDESTTGVVYQKGKDFYDEEGHFLFRIP